MKKDKNIIQKLALTMIPITAAFLIYFYEENRNKEVVTQASSEQYSEENEVAVANEIEEPFDILKLFNQQEELITIGDKKYVYFTHSKNDCEFLLPNEDNLDFDKVIPLNSDACLNYLEEVHK